MEPTPGGGVRQYDEFHSHNSTNSEQILSDTEKNDFIRNAMHVPELPKTEAEYFPQQWVWEGPPFTLNPVRNNQWIVDGSTAGERSAARGDSYDRQEIENLVGALDEFVAGTEQQFLVPYDPQVADFPVDKLFSPPLGSGCNLYRGARRNQDLVGRLPVISRLKYDGELREKSVAEINDEIVQFAKRQGVRLFNPKGHLEMIR